MLSDSEKEIFINLKKYMQSNIDNGYHKFFYNDLGWDFKCIDCINAIDSALKQSKEIEELKITKKELTERVLRLESDEFWNNVVSKDKIKPIQIIDLDGKIHNVYKIEEE